MLSEAIGYRGYQVENMIVWSLKQILYTYIKYTYAFYISDHFHRK